MKNSRFALLASGNDWIYFKIISNHSKKLTIEHNCLSQKRRGVSVRGSVTYDTCNRIRAPPVVIFVVFKLKISRTTLIVSKTLAGFFPIHFITIRRRIYRPLGPRFSSLPTSRRAPYVDWVIWRSATSEFRRARRPETWRTNEITVTSYCFIAVIREYLEELCDLFSLWNTIRDADNRYYVISTSNYPELEGGGRKLIIYCWYDFSRYKIFARTSTPSSTSSYIF